MPEAFAVRAITAGALAVTGLAIIVADNVGSIGGGGVLRTLTIICGETAMLPAASRATAVRP